MAYDQLLGMNKVSPAFRTIFIGRLYIDIKNRYVFKYSDKLFIYSLYSMSVPVIYLLSQVEFEIWGAIWSNQASLKSHWVMPVFSFFFFLVGNLHSFEFRGLHNITFISLLTFVGMSIHSCEASDINVAVLSIPLILFSTPVTFKKKLYYYKLIYLMCNWGSIDNCHKIWYYLYIVLFYQ